MYLEMQKLLIISVLASLRASAKLLNCNRGSTKNLRSSGRGIKEFVTGCMKEVILKVLQRGGT